MTDGFRNNAPFISISLKQTKNQNFLCHPDNKLVSAPSFISIVLGYLTVAILVMEFWMQESHFAFSDLLHRLHNQSFKVLELSNLNLNQTLLNWIFYPLCSVTVYFLKMINGFCEENFAKPRKPIPLAQQTYFFTFADLKKMPNAWLQITPDSTKRNVSAHFLVFIVIPCQIHLQNYYQKNNIFQLMEFT